VSDLIVDASVAVKWFTREVDKDRAKAILQSDHTLLAPRLIVGEVANALARKVGQGLVTKSDATEYLLSVPILISNLLDTDDLIRPAFENACNHRHPIYDFIYLQAARNRNTQMVTADSRFVARLAGSSLARFVMPLSDWQPA
jgi:predicted nucleic acid-binding protein